MLRDSSSLTARSWPSHISINHRKWVPPVWLNHKKWVPQVPRFWAPGIAHYFKLPRYSPMRRVPSSIFCLVTG
jgi:hypothetical protein